jgi:hypothetical protein
MLLMKGKVMSNSVIRRLAQSLSGRRSIKAVAIGSMLLALVVLLGAGGAPKPVTPHVSQSIHTDVTHSATASTAAAQHLAASRSINPHLHVAHSPTATRALELAGTPSIVIVHRHPGWHYHWPYHTWAVSHRGLGAIEGIVYDPSGRPVPGALVALKRPGGKIFADVHKRHITRTNANGAFVMTGVRTGNYRVVAHKNKSRGHVQLAVATGKLSAAAIRI